MQKLGFLPRVAEYGNVALRNAMTLSLIYVNLPTSITPN
jgi:hypothetical protein